MAHTARNEFDVDFTGPEVDEFDVVADDQVFVQFGQDGGLHLLLQC